MTNEDELRDYLELVAANLRRTRGCLREVEEKYAGPVAIAGLGACALTTWRRGGRGGAAAADWRYQVTWLPAADSPSAALPGTWLLVAPDQRRFRAMVTQCAAAMTARGARVDTLLVDCAAVSWDILAGLLESALAGESLAGVVSLLALSEPAGTSSQAAGPAAPTQPAAPTGPAGPAGTLALVQALGSAGITAPLWMLTRDPAAASSGASEPVAGDAMASGPVAGGPGAGGPWTGGPVLGASVAGASVAGDPVAGGPVAGDPVAGGSVAGGSVAGGPVLGASVAGDPVAGSPVAGGPVAGGLAGGALVAAGRAAGEPAHPGPWGAGGTGDLPAELGARAAALLRAGLPGWDADLAAGGTPSRRRGRRRAKPALA